MAICRCRLLLLWGSFFSQQRCGVGSHGAISRIDRGHVKVGRGALIPHSPFAIRQGPEFWRESSFGVVA